jgi:hypothetical protein
MVLVLQEVSLRRWVNNKNIRPIKKHQFFNELIDDRLRQPHDESLGLSLLILLYFLLFNITLFCFPGNYQYRL